MNKITLLILTILIAPQLYGGPKKRKNNSKTYEVVPTTESNNFVNNNKKIQSHSVRTAGRNNNYDRLKTLLEKNYDPNNWAIYSESSGSYDSCLEGDKLHNSALFDAIEFNNLKSMVLLVKYKADINFRNSHAHTPLWEAARLQRFKAAQLLLKNKANPNKCDLLYITPAWWAIENDDKQMLQLLLKNKTIPTAKNDNGQSLVMKAVEEGKLSLVRLLLNAIANADQKVSDEESQDLLMEATEKVDLPIVKLLEDNIDSNILDREKALQEAKEYQRLNQQLIEYLEDQESQQA